MDTQKDSKIAKALLKPVILHPGWMEVPEYILNDIKIQRIQQIERDEEGEATDAEVLAYLMSASMVAPMRSEWVKIYTFIVQKYLEWKKIPRPGFLKDDIVLTDYEKDELRRLRVWLWEKAEKAFKEKVKKKMKRKKKV